MRLRCKQGQLRSGESRQSVTRSEDKPTEGQWEGPELLSRGAGLEVGSSCHPWGCPGQTPAHSPHTTDPSSPGGVQALHGYFPADAITTGLIREPASSPGLSLPVGSAALQGGAGRSSRPPGGAKGVLLVR